MDDEQLAHPGMVEQLARGGAVLCHLDRGDLDAVRQLLDAEGVFDDPGEALAILLGMGEIALMLARDVLGERETSRWLANLTAACVAPPAS